MSRIIISIKENIAKNKLLEATSLLKYNSDDILEYFYEDEIFISWANLGKTVYFKKFNTNDIVIIVGNLFSTEYTLESFCDLAYNDSEKAFSILDGYVLMIVKKNKETILANDVLGFLKLYKQIDREVYSTEMKCLQYLFDNPINIEAISQKAYAFFTINQSLLKNIQLYPSGRYTKIKKNLMDKVENKILNFESIVLSDEEIIEKIDFLLERSYEGYRLNDKKHNISLSGGFDSRFVLGKSLQKSSEVIATTFSGTKDLENIISEELCNLFDLKKSTFKVEEFSFSTVEQYVYQYEEIASVDSLFYTKFIDSIDKGIFISGLLTDLLTGSHLKFSENLNPKSFLKKSSETALGEKDIKILNINKMEEDLYCEYDELNKKYNDSQSITLLNIYTRQKLWVSFVYKAVMNSGDGVVPTYNQKFIEFMLSLPFEKLEKQYIYRKFFRIKYPKLSEIISTYDYQPINEDENLIKKIKKVLLKQYFRFTQKYSTIELIEAHSSEILIFINKNKLIFNIYFTESLFKDLEYSLKNFTQYKRYLNKILKKRILTDISIMIIVNTIIFHKIFSKEYNNINICKISKV